MKLGILAITITSSILLIACKNVDVEVEQPLPSETSQMHNDWGNMYENTQMNVLAPLSKNTETTEEKAIAETEPVQIPAPVKKPRIKSSTTASIPPAPATAPAPSSPQMAQTLPPQQDWQPNEALLIRGNELITGLQRDIGRKPNLTEMQQRLQTHMGLSAPQAQQVIAVLGLS